MMKKVSFKTARKYFYHGIDIYMCRRGLVPDNMWEPALRINATMTEMSFVQLFNSFSYYNGKPTYYIKED